MGTFSGIEEAREFFRKDRFATDNGMTLEELGEDYALCSLTLDERHLNANGGVMGGAIFTLADLAFAALSNQIHRPTVAQQVSIYYLGAPKGKQLTARAECRKNGRTTTVINVDIRDETGRDVAQFTGSGFKL